MDLVLPTMRSFDLRFVGMQPEMSKYMGSQYLRQQMVSHWQVANDCSDAHLRRTSP